MILSLRLPKSKCYQICRSNVSDVMELFVYTGDKLLKADPILQMFLCFQLMSTYTILKAFFEVFICLDIILLKQLLEDSCNYETYES